MKYYLWWLTVTVTKIEFKVIKQQYLKNCSNL